jgi:hypothetical protein
VFAVGDAAAIPTERGSDQICPQLAQAAIQSGRHAADQIVSQTRGKTPRPFRYRDKGTMATIGRRAAIAQLRGGTILRGTIGWLAWFGLHLVYLVGFRNRLTVLVNWTWRYLNWPSGPRIIIEGLPQPRAENIPASQTPFYRDMKLAGAGGTGPKESSSGGHRSAAIRGEHALSPSKRTAQEGSLRAAALPPMSQTTRVAYWRNIRRRARW